MHGHDLTPLLKDPAKERKEPVLMALTGDQFVDLSQTQYLESDAISQEFRFTSPAENRLRWIAGAYFIGTERYISTGNQIDRGNGVFPVRRTPRPSVFVDPTDPAELFLHLLDETVTQAVDQGTGQRRRQQPRDRIQRQQQCHRRQWDVQVLPDIDGQERPDHPAAGGTDQHPTEQQP